MEKDAYIIVFDKMVSSKMRIKRIFEDHGIRVEDSSKQIEFFNILSVNRDSSCVVIMAMEDDSFDILKKIKLDYPQVPVIILSSVTKREFFLKSIADGASDYILKPFDDDYLYEKVLKLLGSSNVRNESILRFNFHGYLRTEIVKARKGNYPFSLLKCSFYSADKGTNITKDGNYSKNLNNIYEGLRSLFWETDIFIQYGPDSFMGFFPFCGDENTMIIDEKVKSKFEMIKSVDENIRKYEIINTFVTYPHDGDDVEGLLDELKSKTNVIERLGGDV